MSKRKALLVDDSKSARFFLRNMLQKKDIKVDMVDSGEAALEFLKENRPDVIFMDHLMPGIDGFETTQAIKKDAATSAIPVVMCTSNEGAEYAAQAKGIGAFDILNKPPTEDRLTQILDELEGAPEIPAAAPAPEVPGISREEIEAIARSAAEAAAQARVEALLAEMVEKLRGDLLNALQTQIGSQAGEAAKSIVQENMIGLKDELLEATLEASGNLAKGAAGELLDSRMSDIVNQVSKPMEENLKSLRSELASNRDSLLKEAKDSAAKSAESALVSAQKSITDSASLFAKEAAKQAAEQAARDAVAEASKGMGSSASQAAAEAKKYAMAAGGVGILAALVVFFLG